MSWLKNINTLIDDQRQVLKIYGFGAVLFFVGIGFILYADRVIPASMQQEIIVLLGLAIGGTGFTTAMGAQVLLILGRFKNMGQRP